MSDDAPRVLAGSAGLIETQIKNWIRQHVCAVSKDYGRCKKIVVRHLNVERKPIGDVHTINIASDSSMEGTEIADKVINEIADSTLRDANDMQAGVQTYAAYAFYTNDANYVPRKVFRAAADEEVTHGLDPSEPANEKGLVAQLMRHNEINSKNSLVSMGFIIQTLQKEVSEQRGMNKHFMEQQIESALLVQEVMNDAHDRRLKEKKAEMEMSVVEGVFEHLKVILPIIANKFAGKDIIPGPMPKEIYLLSSFLENLSPQQQTVMRDMLSPQQIATLAELLGGYEEKKAKLIGEKIPTEDDAPSEGKKTNGTTGSKPPNRLAALFEKRTSLIARDTRLEIKDDVTRKIEERAQRLKDKLSEAMKPTDEEPKD